MRSSVSVVLTAAFVSAALALSLLVPAEEFQQGPFVQTVSVPNVKVDSREFSVTVTKATLADRVQTPDWTGTTEGVWLVVDIVFERRIDPGPITGTFHIGDIDYDLSTRPDTVSIDGGAARSQPGIPWAGSMLVELPLSALELPGADAAVLRFATQSDTRLEGVVDYRVDLTKLDRVASVTISEPGRVEP